ncbi:MAG TPA: hypothetical protein PK156_51590, partial [Polyangium sp.]|nr:hypothetical protein [Polyangium sp.]
MHLKYLDAADLAGRLGFDRLVNGLATAFLDRVDVPLRQRVEASDGRALLLMPVADERHAGVKMLTIVPANAMRNEPVIQGLYVVFDFTTGKPIAAMDAAELTSRRTAAVSALAADRLAHPKAQRLLLVGSGNLVPYFAEALLSVRSFAAIEIWARDPNKALKAVERVIARTKHQNVTAAQDLEAAARGADMISCLTGATAPLILGEWLKQGAHLDLVGSHRPDMREADDVAFARARIFVDDKAAVLAESGDVMHPLAKGVISAESI